MGAVKEDQSPWVINETLQLLLQNPKLTMHAFSIHFGNAGGEVRSSN
jgi:hypothetical protein